ncbi:MAG: DUF4446 family protein [Thermoleophilaceae bacterium]|jgi:hypothetical protein
MHDLTSTTGIVALAAGGVALVSLLFAIVVAFRLRRVRRDQKAVLGTDGSQRDLVAHALQIQRGFTDLRDLVDETMASLETTLENVHHRLDGCVTHQGLVRYDAYNELSGQQSSSLALLDSHRSGVILTSIVHRDQARIYLKRITEGEAEIELSPEEQQAVEAALQPAAAQHAA